MLAIGYCKEAVVRILVLALLLCPAGGTLPLPAAVLVPEASCAACKAKLKPDAKFCAACGEKVPELKCAECKAVLKPGAKFCASCGKKVEAAPATPPAKPAEPAARPAEPDVKPPAKPVVKPAEPGAEKPQVGQDPRPDAVKERRGQELEKFGVTAEQINRAIERGAAFLAAKLLKQTYLQNEDYLLAYALEHTNAYHSNGKLRERIQTILRDPSWVKSSPKAYTVALRALALEASKDPDLAALAGECAQYLVEAQGPHGSWNYDADVPLVEAAVGEGKADAKPGISVSGGEPLDEIPPGIELARKGTAKTPASDGDTSCTQFALLGLHAAEKAGFRIPKEVWKKCLDEMLKRHSTDGGWHYHGAANESYGSMTCAGVCSVALCRYYLGEKDYLSDPKLQAGLKWLGDHFSVEKNPKVNNWPLYYLYSVERVGVLAATETLGAHRWYPLGAKHLVAIQKADGSWKPDNEDEHVGTAFAILFLTRATAPVKQLKRGGRGWLESHVLNDAQNFLFILDASGSMREEMDGREKFDIAKEVVESIVTRLPEGTLVGMRVYGHRFTALQREADTDSELVVPVAPLKLPEFLVKLKSLRCRGKTPITHSLAQTAGDVASVPAEVDVVAILLTDGAESTRGARPEEAAAKLAASRKGMKVHVVGFDIGDDAWREQLESVAAAGGGAYVHAPKAKELLEALAIVTGGGSSAYAVLDKAGKELLRGKLGDRHELPEGKYEFVFDRPDKSVDRKVFWVNTEVVTHVTVRLLKK
jgi:hypothetical protein